MSVDVDTTLSILTIVEPVPDPNNVCGTDFTESRHAPLLRTTGAEATGASATSDCSAVVTANTIVSMHALFGAAG